jgi:hypothetical protein
VASQRFGGSPQMPGFATYRPFRATRLGVVARDISIEPGELPVPPAGTEPERVYHYAGVTGLKGIIGDQCLWASDVWYVNDSREALYGLGALERALQAMTPGTGLESDVHQAALDRLANLGDQEGFLHSYIACLSKKRRSQPVASVWSAARVLNRLRPADAGAALSTHS